MRRFTAALAVLLAAGFLTVAIGGAFAQGGGWHKRGAGYTDQNNDGICGFRQNTTGPGPRGGCGWGKGSGYGMMGQRMGHGPGFVDKDNNGVCDYREQVQTDDSPGETE